MNKKGTFTKNILHITTRTEWRNWLKKNFKTESEAWLVYYKKGTGKPRIQYNDAVEEAICFGWIDSIVRKLDDKSIIQRFSRRSLKSKYSQANKVRLRSLVYHPRFLDMLHTLLVSAFFLFGKNPFLNKWRSQFI